MVGGVEVHTLMVDTLNINEAHTREQWKRIWDRKIAGKIKGEFENGKVITTT